ncbi:CheR family methyltransferase [Niveibacterium sp. SC-1]|uniref:CheR family methyltransferase n=1 Tax=Niveibacterium sp. SC-1 TaxID=3135646 RepID=UPI00311F7BAC
MSAVGDALAAAELSPRDYEDFCAYFLHRTGIAFDAGKRYFVDKRLLARMAQTGHPGFDSYFAALRSGLWEAEVQALINAMTVNETYFFREEYQLQCLSNSLLPELLTRLPEDATLRLWSVPCASGEEPYSIAIHLLDQWADIEQRAVEIFGSDIDTAMLAAARRGFYSPRALQHAPPSVLHRYFKAEAGGYRISQDLSECVAFSTVNVADPVSMRAYRDMDVIFCRNVLIYFDDFSRRIAADALFDALRPGGFLCLGHSESMSRISPLFEVRRFPDAIVYQKPLEPR